jgi:hypothetical protein
MEKDKEAMICYKKSLAILNREKEPSTLINKGYAYLWIADILNKEGNTNDAAYFYKYAYIVWKQVSPPRARLVETDLSGKANYEEKFQQISNLEKWQIESICKEFLDKIE